MNFETTDAPTDIKKRLGLIVVIVIGLVIALLLNIGDRAPDDIVFDDRGLVTELVFSANTPEQVTGIVLVVERSNYRGPVIAMLSAHCRIIDAHGSVAAAALSGRRVRVRTIGEEIPQKDAPQVTVDVIFVEP